MIDQYSLRSQPKKKNPLTFIFLRMRKLHLSLYKVLEYENVF